MAKSGDPRADFAPVGAASDADIPPAALPASVADASYDASVADLQSDLDAARGSLDPETVRVIETNLGAIDRAIEQCREALASDPANAYLNAHLTDTRQRKLALLRTAAALAATPGR
jgi:hypothetical protein